MDVISGLDKISALSNGELSGEEDGFGILETAYIKVTDDRENMQQALTTSRTKSVLSALSSSRSASINDSRTIKVQFNPNTISFTYGDVETDKKKTNIVQNDSGNAPQSEAEDKYESISVSFKLVFDRSIYIDSSVQPEVEQFLALLRNPYVRQIDFYWGTMCYKGSLKNISAEYVLFNSLGIPMRADVNVTMKIK